MSKPALFATIGALVLAALFFAYRAFDSGVTITYHQAEINNLQQTRKVLAGVVMSVAKASSTSRQDVEKAIKGHFGDDLLDQEGDTLFVDQVGLRFKEGQLVGVWFPDDEPSATEPSE